MIKIRFGEESEVHYDEETGRPKEITLSSARKYDIHKALGHELRHIERRRKYGALPSRRLKRVKVGDVEIYALDEDAELRDILEDELWTEDWAIKKRKQRWTPYRLALFVVSCAELFQYDNYDVWKIAKPIIAKLGIDSRVITKTLAILKSQPEWPTGATYIREELL